MTDKSTAREAWEYKEFYIGSTHVEGVLNVWGKEGWELVSVNPNTYIAYFKRQKL